MTTVESIKYNIRDWELFDTYVEVYFQEGDFILKIDIKDFNKDIIDVNDIAQVIYDKYR